MFARRCHCQPKFPPAWQRVKRAPRTGGVLALGLAAMLAMITCCEHALHDLVHGAAESAELARGFEHQHCDLHERCPSQGLPGSATDSPDHPHNPLGPQHDSDDCAICRFLTLPQHVESVPELPPAEIVAEYRAGCDADLTVPDPERLLFIRGPPGLAS